MFANASRLRPQGCAKERHRPAVDGREAREATQIAVAAHESLATGKLVQINP